MAALLLAVEAFGEKRVTAHYIEVTGNTHPECTNYVRRVCRSLGVELVEYRRTDLDFFECFLAGAFPRSRRDGGARDSLSFLFSDEPKRGCGLLGLEEESRGFVC